jgi:recombination protein RecR
MAGTIEPIARMVTALSHLPGIGQKSAQRLAYHIVSLPQDEVRELAAALWQGRKAIRYCAVCGNYTAGERCNICEQEERHNGQICVVRDPRDVLAVERMNEYRGLYHVLHGTLSPMDGIGPDNIRIKELIDRVKEGEVKEVVLATNPDVEGEATASYIAKQLKPLGVRTTRIAHGIPIGGNLEYVDEITLFKAMENRREV